MPSFVLPRALPLGVALWSLLLPSDLRCRRARTAARASGRLCPDVNFLNDGACHRLSNELFESSRPRLSFLTVQPKPGLGPAGVLTWTRALLRDREYSFSFPRRTA